MDALSELAVLLQTKALYGQRRGLHTHYWLETDLGHRVYVNEFQATRLINEGIVLELHETVPATVGDMIL